MRARMLGLLQWLPRVLAALWLACALMALPGSAQTANSGNSGSSVVFKGPIFSAPASKILTATKVNQALAAPAANTGTAQGGATSTFKVGQDFNHQNTRFPLEGMHVKVTCETCHKGGIFKGTPITCQGCHNGDTAKGKNLEHPKTSAECANCHNQVDFSQVHVDHTTIHDGCFACHDNVTAEGKGGNHIKSSTACQDCHLTTTWRVARFNHENTVERCETCHDNRHAIGKPANHIRSTNDCGQCHRTVDWKIGVFDHTGVVNGCVKCHDGVQATGKSGAHLPTSDECQTCHTTVAWAPAHFDHTDISVQGRSCVDCHDGRRAAGRSNAHFATASNDCALCHDQAHSKNFTTWAGALWDHKFALDVAQCVNCHNGQRPPALGKPTGHIPSNNTCTDCHDANNFVTWANAKFAHAQTSAPCVNCHNGSVTGAQSMKDAPPPGHLNTNNNCGDCHNSSDTGGPWKPAKSFNHADTTASCVTCHNGTTAISKGVLTSRDPKTHLSLGNTAADNRCESCHTTSSWKGAVFDHANLGAQRCDSCHSGGNPAIVSINTATHVKYNSIGTKTGTDCNGCHTNTSTFTPATLDHKQVTKFTCLTCHNGSTAVGSWGTLTTMGGNHLTVNKGAACESCHTSTSSWLTVKFDHNQVSTACSTCHNGTTAISTGKLTTKILNHIATTAECGTCHNTTSWKTVFDHSKIGSATCVSCHNGTTVTGKVNDRFGAHIPSSDNCQLCHLNFTAFSPAITGNTLHTVAEVAAHASCTDCHNGGFTTSKGLVTAKPTVHIAIPPGNNCNACHTSFTTWVTKFDHTGVAVGTCFTCHNGKTATGKPAGTAHIQSSDTCDNCHKSTTVWLPVVAPFNHADPGIGSTTCETCHNGTLATGRNAATHIATLVNACGDCHQYLSWTTIKPGFHKDLSTNCYSCHDGNHKTATKAITPKSGAHMATSTLCASCHTTVAWQPAKMPFDHTQASGTCVTCHDGTKKLSTGTVLGKNTGHVKTSTDCASCHTTTAFKPATFSHADSVVQATTCITCHNGTVANAKSKTDAAADPKAPNHAPATFDNCANCHTTTAFIPAHFDHGTVAGQKCASCHDTGMKNAVVRPVTHAPFTAASQDCGDCHTTATWVTNAKPDHTKLVNNCFSCHNGTAAKGMTVATHFATTNVCENCHNTTSFVPANTFDHTQAKAITPCVTCHDGKRPPALGKSSFPAHLPTSDACELCHSGYTSWVTTKFDHTDTTVVNTPCANCHDGAHTPAIGKNIPHLSTSNDCASCHNTTKFAPAKLPFNHADSGVAGKACVTCHDGGHKLASGTIITGKTPTHVPTNNVCEGCHNTTSWANAVFDHSSVKAGTACATCHDGKTATGRSGSHIVINSPPLCDTCHKSYAAWKPVVAAAVDHTQVSSTCFNCHNTTIASGKPTNHVKSSNNCATCHRTGGQPWTVYTFDHSDSVVAATACFTCHNGTVTNAQPKDAAHLNTSNLCANCHASFKVWGPVPPTSFDHTQANGTCAACHNGTNKLGVTGTLVDHKSTTHFITTQDCSVCHTTTAWNPMLNYTHISAAYVKHYFGTTAATCITCHKQNNEKITYQQPSLFPNCAACHANNFKPDSHPKYSSPVRMNYTFIELKDCTGACHEYTDQTLSKIKQTHTTNPKHRPTSTSWN